MRKKALYDIFKVPKVGNKSKKKVKTNTTDHESASTSCHNQPGTVPYRRKSLSPP